jgi:hypothetical protein
MKLSNIEMNQHFRESTKSMFRRNSQEIDIFAFSLLPNANSNPELNQNNAEKEDDAQNKK